MAVDDNDRGVSRRSAVPKPERVIVGRAHREVRCLELHSPNRTGVTAEHSERTTRPLACASGAAGGRLTGPQEIGKVAHTMTLFVGNPQFQIIRTSRSEVISCRTGNSCKPGASTTPAVLAVGGSPRQMR